MLNIDNKIEDLRNYFKTNENILSVWIIGSYKTVHQHEGSDIDFAVLFDGDANLLDEIRIADSISAIIKFEDVDIVNLKHSPITLQFKTLKEGNQIYERDYLKVSDYIESVLNRYRDAKYYISRFNQDFLSGFQKGESSKL